MITLESIFSKKNISHALDHLSRKTNGGGSDVAPMTELISQWELNRERIQDEIVNKTFTPNIVHEYEIINGKGKCRKVNNFTGLDKFITRLITQKLNSYFQPLFCDNSFAFQEGKGIQCAVNQIREYVRNNNETLVEIDIKHFYDNISLEKLMNILRNYIHDDRVLYLIDVYLHCTVSYDGQAYKKEKGLIQGLSMSPVLSNVYLHTLDVYMKEKGYHYVRFCDDIYIVIPNDFPGEEVYNEISELLKSEYLLEVNESKSGIYSIYERRILGYDFVKKRNHISVERHPYDSPSYYRKWHDCVIERVNKEYHITRNGILNKKDYALLFENEEEKHHIPVEATEQLNIYNEITITSSVINTLSKENVRLAFYDKYGDVLGYFIPEKCSKDNKTSLMQYKEYTNVKLRLRTAKSMEVAAIHNIRANVRYYIKKGIDLLLLENELTVAIKHINECKTIDDLLLEEARCRQLYYQSYNKILHNNDFTFEKRTKRPPMDAINALISFGNTLLYNRVQQIIWKTSLNSGIGIFHAANKRHYSLNLDFADLFKPIIVDRIIFSIINRKQISKDDFVNLPNGGVYLSGEAKKLFINEFNDRMSCKLVVKNKKLTYQQLVEQEIYSYYKYIVDGDKYKPYKYY